MCLDIASNGFGSVIRLEINKRVGQTRIRFYWNPFVEQEERQ